MGAKRGSNYVGNTIKRMGGFHGRIGRYLYAQSWKKNSAAIPRKQIIRHVYGIVTLRSCPQNQQRKSAICAAISRLRRPFLDLDLVIQTEKINGQLVDRVFHRTDPQWASKTREYCLNRFNRGKSHLDFSGDLVRGSRPGTLLKEHQGHPELRAVENLATAVGAVSDKLEKLLQQPKVKRLPPAEPEKKS